MSEGLVQCEWSREVLAWVQVNPWIHVSSCRTVRHADTCPTEHVASGRRTTQCSPCQASNSAGVRDLFECLRFINARPDQRLPWVSRSARCYQV